LAVEKTSCNQATTAHFVCHFVHKSRQMTETSIAVSITAEEHDLGVRNTCRLPCLSKTRMPGGVAHAPRAGVADKRSHGWRSEVSIE
jgi:hypothetical protein